MSADVHADRPLCGVIVTRLGIHLSILHRVEQHAAIMVPAEHRFARSRGQPDRAGVTPRVVAGN